jgi:flagellar biosynthesis/type III secretory pathway M-ring protein FliF/YscJ
MSVIEEWVDKHKDKITNKLIANKKKIILIISLIILIIGIILLIVYVDEISLKLYFLNGFSFLFIIIGSINILNLIFK